MTDDERQQLVTEYHRYLEYNRLPAHLPTSRAEASEWTAEIRRRAETNPHWDAWETLDGLIDLDPQSAWSILLELIATCEVLDLGSLGAGPLETLIYRKHADFADRFEREILCNNRFRDTFLYVYMGGVPRAVQRRLNEALAETGIDPSTLTEFDD